MRIGLIIPQIRVGGGTYQLLELARGLKRLGHEIYIYTIFDQIVGVDKESLNGFTIKSCNFSREEINPHRSALFGFLRFMYSLFSSTYRLFDLIKKDNLDIINPHEWNSQWAAVVVKMLTKTPVIWTCNDVWHIPGYEEPSEKRILFRIARKTLIKWIDK